MQETKRELQTEQTPHMNPTPFNVMKARAQASGGMQQRRYAHQDLRTKGRAQEAEHQARMKEILSR